MPKKKEESKPKKSAKFLMPSEHSWSQDEDQANEYLKSENFSPKKALELLTGEYGHLDHDSRYVHSELLENLKDNPHVNDEVKSKTFDHLYERMRQAQGEEITKKPDESDEDFEWRKGQQGAKEVGHINNHVTHMGASPEHITKLLDDPYYMAQQGESSRSLPEAIKQNDKLDPKTLKAILEHEGEGDGYKDIKNAALYHDNVDEKDAKRFIKEALKGSRRIDSSDLAAHKYADADDKHKAIKAIYGKTNANQSIIQTLDSLPENEKKEHVDALLGITHGKKSSELPPDEDYQNWDEGKHYNKSAADHLAEFGKLSDEQAEHLIRHGTKEQKVGLFHNPNLKPEHYEHIYKKFADEHDHHGFDIDELKERILEDNRDHLQDRVYDSARESAENDNPISDYIRDLDDADVIRMNDEAHERSSGRSGRANPFSHSDEIGHEIAMEHLDNSNWKGEHDWTGDNPDFDSSQPESEENPKQIDFDNHDKYSHHEHPEFEEREQAALDEVYSSSDYKSQVADRIRDKWNSDQMPDDLYEGYSEWNQDATWEYENKYMKDELDNALSDKKLLPEHISANVAEIRDAEQLRRQREEQRRIAETQARDKANKEYVDKLIPNRTEAHEYAPGQHHHEMVKDYADANGGAIDIGAMNKIHPNLKDKWKEVFGDKGKISSQEVQQKIESLPKQKFNITYGKWDKNQMQNTNRQDEAVIRLDHSEDSMKEIEADPELKNIFDKINDAAQRSGHPTNPKTIAWARLDPTDKKHWFVDEMQSDFESSARDYLEKQGHKDMADRVGKIADIQKSWREALMNHVIKLAKQNGVEKISTHSPESKAAHTGADKVHSVYENSYKKIPRQLGFKAAEHDTLPLSDEGKSVFQKARLEGESGDRFEKHYSAMQDHAAIAATHDYMSGQALGSNNRELSEAHDKMSKHHLNMSRQHKEMAQQIDPSHTMVRRFSPNGHDEAHLRPDIKGFGEYRNPEQTRHEAVQHAQSGEAFAHEHDSLLAEAPKPVKPHQGHTLVLSAPQLKKSIEVAEALIKMELLRDSIRSRFSMR